MTNTIICGTCKTEQPIDCFAKNRSKRSGLSTACRTCCKASYFQRKTTPKTVPSEQQCQDCEQVKPALMFREDISHSTGLKRRCIPCVRIKANAYARSPSGRASRQRYAERNQEHMREYRRNYRENSEVYRAKQQRYMKEYAANEGVRRVRTNNALLRQFGITLETYELILKEQNGGCAICSKAENGRRLAVDHDHSTGVIRGLLCALCNTAIGKFHDDPALLRKAANYILASVR